MNVIKYNSGQIFSWNVNKISVYVKEILISTLKLYLSHDECKYFEMSTSNSSWIGNDIMYAGVFLLHC